MKRIFLSGSRKRKLAEEKKQKDEEVVKKLPKLTSFFQTFTSLSNNPDGATNVAEDDGGQKIQEPYLAVDNNNDATIPNLAHQGNRNNDSGTWTELTADDISYWTNEGPQKCQHHSSSLENSRRISKMENKQDSALETFLMERKPTVKSTLANGCCILHQRATFIVSFVNFFHLMSHLDWYLDSVIGVTLVSLINTKILSLIEKQCSHI